MLPPKREYEVTFHANGVKISTIVHVRDDGIGAIDAARERIAIAYDIPLRLLMRGACATSAPVQEAE